MTCFYCGTELPSGAMFCGECGRPVNTKGGRSTKVSRAAADAASGVPEAAPADAVPLVQPVAVAEPAVEPEHVAVAEPVAAPIVEPVAVPVAAPVVAPQPPAEPVAVAEPEPERVVEPEPERAVQPEPVAAPQPAPVAIVPEPVIVVAPEPVAPPEPIAPPEPVVFVAPAAEPVRQAEPEPLPEIEPDLEPDPAYDVDVAESTERCDQCGAPLAASDIFCPECGFVRQRVSPAARPADTNVLDPFPWGLPRSTEPVTNHVHVPAAPDASSLPFAAEIADVSETRLVPRGPRGERFVLQFSTGESVSVSGTGLIGRNPMAEPGEYFDTLVAVIDPGRSVSKTHLEFGQDDTSFWVSDRYSGNGTVVREPDREPRRCEAGKRYRVARGARVEIGEQFFIVS